MCADKSKQVRAYTSPLRGDVRAPPDVAANVAVCCLPVYRQSMAIYRLSAKVISKADGRSATAAAAYRAGALVVDRSTGLVHDYTRRAGVAESFLMAPCWAPAWVHDRETLWNTVQDAEKRKDAQLCREVQIALPHELGESQRAELLRNFVQRAFVDAGMVADVAIHLPDGNGSELNHHAHIMLSMRAIGTDGFGLKCREWNDKELLVNWRVMWEQMANKALSDAGIGVQIDCRTLEAQRADALAQGELEKAEALDRVPAKKIGWAAMKAVRWWRQNEDQKNGDVVMPARALAHIDVELANSAKAAAVSDLAKARAAMRAADEKAQSHMREANSNRLRQSQLSVLPVAELQRRIDALAVPSVEDLFNSLGPILAVKQKLQTAQHDSKLALDRADAARRQLVQANEEIDTWDRNRPIRKLLLSVGLFRDVDRENLIAKQREALRQVETFERARIAADALLSATKDETGRLSADPALKQRAADIHAEKVAAVAPQLAELQKALKVRQKWSQVGKAFLADDSENSDASAAGRPTPNSGPRL